MMASPSKNKPVYRINHHVQKGCRDLGNFGRIYEERPFQSTATS